MTDPIPTRSRTAATADEPRARKHWESPALARIDTSAAENSANPTGADAIISMGS